MVYFLSPPSPSWLCAWILRVCDKNNQQWLIFSPQIIFASYYLSHHWGSHFGGILRILLRHTNGNICLLAVGEFGRGISATISNGDFVPPIYIGWRHIYHLKVIPAAAIFHSPRVPWELYYPLVLSGELCQLWQMYSSLPLPQHSNSCVIPVN